MSKRDLFKEIRDGLRDYAANPDALSRRQFADPDPGEIRRRLNLTQGEMAALMNVSIRTWQNWEQQHRTLTGPVKAFLRVLEAEPEAVFRAIQPTR
jgi:putative transcriptional regulator